MGTISNDSSSKKKRKNNDALFIIGIYQYFFIGQIIRVKIIKWSHLKGNHYVIFAHAMIEHMFCNKKWIQFMLKIAKDKNHTRKFDEYYKVLRIMAPWEIKIILI